MILCVLVAILILYKTLTACLTWWWWRGHNKGCNRPHSLCARPYLGFTSHWGLQRVASFRPFRSGASRRHRASWVNAAGEPAARWSSFSGLAGQRVSTIPWSIMFVMYTYRNIVVSLSYTVDKYLSRSRIVLHFKNSWKWLTNNKMIPHTCFADCSILSLDGIQIFSQKS